MEQRGGKFLPIERSLPHFRETIVLANEPPPAVAHSARLPATLVTCVAEVDHKTRSWPDEGMFGTSTAPKAVTTRDVLLYAEGRLPRQAMVWINHPEPIFLDGDANAIAVVERNCLMGCEYVLVTNRADASHLREAVKNFLFPRLKWKHYRGTHVYDLLKNKLQNEFHDWTDLPEVNENNPDFASPIWMQFHAIVLQDANEVLAARYHDSPSWIFEFHAKGGLPHDVVGFSIGRGEFVGNAMRRPDWETQTQLEVLQNFKTTNLWKRLGPCDFAANEGLPTTAILSASGRPTICKGAVEP